MVQAERGAEGVGSGRVAEDAGVLWGLSQGHRFETVLLLTFSLGSLNGWTLCPHRKCRMALYPVLAVTYKEKI